MLAMIPSGLVVKTQLLSFIATTLNFNNLEINITINQLSADSGFNALHNHGLVLWSGFPVKVLLSTLVNFTLWPPSTRWLHQPYRSSNQTSHSRSLRLRTPASTQSLHAGGDAPDHRRGIAQPPQEVWNTTPGRHL